MKLTPVLKGQPILFAVEGGFARKPAPCDGYAVDVGSTCAFVPARDVETATVDLKLLKRNGGRR